MPLQKNERGELFFAARKPSKKSRARGARTKADQEQKKDNLKRLEEYLASNEKESRTVESDLYPLTRGTVAAKDRERVNGLYAQRKELDQRRAIIERDLRELKEVDDLKAQVEELDSQIVEKSKTGGSSKRAEAKREEVIVELGDATRRFHIAESRIAERLEEPEKHYTVASVFSTKTIDVDGDGKVEKDEKELVSAKAAVNAANTKRLDLNLSPDEPALRDRHGHWLSKSEDLAEAVADYKDARGKTKLSTKEKNAVNTAAGVSNSRPSTARKGGRGKVRY